MNTMLKTENGAVARVIPPQQASATTPHRTPPAEAGRSKRPNWARLLVILAIIAVAVGADIYAWKAFHPKNDLIASGNGRIEATDIDIAEKIPGRIEKIFVDEGDFVEQKIDSISLNPGTVLKTTAAILEKERAPA
jgi:multidrug resistance efflux pump